MENDIIYFRRRARQETAMARQAACERSASIHHTLARLYSTVDRASASRG